MLYWFKSTNADAECLQARKEAERKRAEAAEEQRKREEEEEKRKKLQVGSLMFKFTGFTSKKSTGTDT